MEGIMPNSINQEAIDYTNPKAVAAAAEAAIADLVADVDMTEEADCRYRFDAQFVPNKPGGTAGRYMPVLITYGDDGTEHRDVSFAYSKGKQARQSDAVQPSGRKLYSLRVSGFVMRWRLN